jgi:hypothetical protein
MLIAYLNVKDLRDRVHHAAAHVQIPTPSVRRRAHDIRWLEVTVRMRCLISGTLDTHPSSQERALKSKRSSDIVDFHPGMALSSNSYSTS